MAYTPINWQTGDTITAEKLNKMDNGWSIENTQLFSETVTTTGDGPSYDGQLAYSQRINADIITVTYDGTEYTCPSIGTGEYGALYNDGSFDFSEFPFNLYTSSSEAYLTTQTAGEHTIAVSVLTPQTSSDFDAAVNMASPIDASMLPLRCVEGVTSIDEAHYALYNGRLVYFTTPEDNYEGAPTCGFLINNVGTTCTIVPTSTKITAKFGRNNGLFFIERTGS